MQIPLFDSPILECALPFRRQLLKWVGNKQRFAHEIVSYFPSKYETYFEPFLGSGAVLATLQPKKAIASDIFPPLMEIWRTLHEAPATVKTWYEQRWHEMMNGNKVEVYARIKASYNERPSGADFLFLCRSCYGGVIRFRQADGYMSTPCGIHQPISPQAFSARVDEWYKRTVGTQFLVIDYRDAFNLAKSGDLIYCDPPYDHSQSILYGAQSFILEELFELIADAKTRGIFVALSIDGTKRSGEQLCYIPAPKGLFEREVFVNCGPSMLKRFQMEGKSLEKDIVTDRLLLTY